MPGVAMEARARRESLHIRDLTAHTDAITTAISRRFSLLIYHFWPA
jgi:hypothetical protein